MNSISDPSIDPATWHPSWCDPAECSAPDRLEARGLTEADVPLHRRHGHYSTPVVIGSVEREDAVLALRAERFVDQPPAEPGVDAVELTVEHTLHGTRVVALLEPDLLDRLAAAIADMRAIVRGGDSTRGTPIIPTPAEAAELRALYAGNPVIERAEAALRQRGVDHVRDAVEVVSAIADHGELTERERQAVYARFVPAPAEVCSRCGAPIRYVVAGPDPGWWTHSDVAVMLTDRAAHPATPDYGNGGATLISNEGGDQ